MRAGNAAGVSADCTCPATSVPGAAVNRAVPASGSLPDDGEGCHKRVEVKDCYIHRRPELNSYSVHDLMSLVQVVKRKNVVGVMAVAMRIAAAMVMVDRNPLRLMLPSKCCSLLLPTCVRRMPVRPSLMD